MCKLMKGRAPVFKVAWVPLSKNRLIRPRSFWVSQFGHKLLKERRSIRYIPPAHTELKPNERARADPVSGLPCWLSVPLQTESCQRAFAVGITSLQGFEVSRNGHLRGGGWGLGKMPLE